jgi:hypothetical protein
MRLLQNDANASENGLLPMMAKLMMDKDAVNAKIEYLFQVRKVKTRIDIV